MPFDDSDRGSDVHFFNVLWKRKANQPSPLDEVDLKIPHTIVYEHDFAKGWFSMQGRAEGPKKRIGKEIESKAVIATYVKNTPENPPVVGYYLEKRVDDASGNHDAMRVQFFDKQQFMDWLTNPKQSRSGRQRHGLLQKFVPPAGHKNEMIQVSWTPYVTLMEKRQNIHEVRDQRVSNYEKCVTFEGPAIYSIMTHLSPKTVDDLSRILEAIVVHTQLMEHKLVQRMQLYFKLDNEQKLWLLFPTIFEVKDLTNDVLSSTSPVYTRSQKTKQSYPDLRQRRTQRGRKDGGASGLLRSGSIEEAVEKVMSQPQPNMGPIRDAYYHYMTPSASSQGLLDESRVSLPKYASSEKGRAKLEALHAYAVREFKDRKKRAQDAEDGFTEEDRLAEEQERQNRAKGKKGKKQTESPSSGISPTGVDKSSTSGLMSSGSERSLAFKRVFSGKELDSKNLSLIDGEDESTGDETDPSFFGKTGGKKKKRRSRFPPILPPQYRFLLPLVTDHCYQPKDEEGQPISPAVQEIIQIYPESHSPHRNCVLSPYRHPLDNSAPERRTKIENFQRQVVSNELKILKMQYEQLRKKINAIEEVLKTKYAAFQNPDGSIMVIHQSMLMPKDESKKELKPKPVHHRITDSDGEQSHFGPVSGGEDEDGVDFGPMLDEATRDAIAQPCREWLDEQCYKLYSHDLHDSGAEKFHQAYRLSLPEVLSPVFPHLRRLLTDLGCQPASKAGSPITTPRAGDHKEERGGGGPQGRGTTPVPGSREKPSAKATVAISRDSDDEDEDADISPNEVVHYMLQLRPNVIKVVRKIAFFKTSVLNKVIPMAPVPAQTTDEESGEGNGVNGGPPPLLPPPLSN